MFKPIGLAHSAASNLAASLALFPCLSRQQNTTFLEATLTPVEVFLEHTHTAYPNTRCEHGTAARKLRCIRFVGQGSQVMHRGKS